MSEVNRQLNLKYKAKVGSPGLFPMPKSINLLINVYKYSDIVYDSLGML